MAEFEEDIRRVEVGISFLAGQDSNAALSFAESIKKSTDALTAAIRALQNPAFFRSLSQIVNDTQKLAQTISATGGLKAIGPPTAPSAGDAQKWQQLELFSPAAPHTGHEQLQLFPPYGISATTQAAQNAQTALVQASTPSDELPAVIPPKAEQGIVGQLGRKVADRISMSKMLGAAMLGPSFAHMAGATQAIGGGSMPKQIATDLVAAKLAENLYRGMGSLQHAVGAPISAAKGLLDFYGQTEQGAALGYDRGGSLGLPIMSPLSPAQGEGMRQQIDVMRMALRPGINLQQAGAIEQAATGYGFSGQFGQGVTDQLLAPLFQKFGANPQQIMQTFGAGLRTGVVTVRQLKSALEGLGQSARSASMTLTDTISAVGKAAQSVQQLGGTEQQGIYFGNNFQGITGLPASVGGQLLQNPFVQSQIALNTGVMPALQGALPQNLQIGGIIQAVSTLSQIYGRWPSEKIHMTDPMGGPGFDSTISSEQFSNAMIARQLGIDVGEVKLIRDYAKANTRASFIQAEAGHWSNTNPTDFTKQTHFTNAEIQRAIEHTPGNLRINHMVGKRDIFSHLPQGASVVGFNQHTGDIRLQMPNGTIETGQWGVDAYGHSIYNQNELRKTLSNELSIDQHSKGWDQVVTDIRKSGIYSKSGFKAEIEKLNKISDPHKRAKTVNTDIQNQLAKAHQNLPDSSTGHTINIVMKGQAGQFLKAQPSQITINANSGTGPTMNYAAAQPQGTDYLMGYQPYMDSSGGYGGG